MSYVTFQDEGWGGGGNKTEFLAQSVWVFEWVMCEGKICFWEIWILRVTCSLYPLPTFSTGKYAYVILYYPQNVIGITAVIRWFISSSLAQICSSIWWAPIYSVLLCKMNDTRA